jgi:predicted RecA/RadA family phage recombinase
MGSVVATTDLVSFGEDLEVAAGAVDVGARGDGVNEGAAVLLPRIAGLVPFISGRVSGGQREGVEDDVEGW